MNKENSHKSLILTLKEKELLKEKFEEKYEILINFPLIDTSLFKNDEEGKYCCKQAFLFLDEGEYLIEELLNCGVTDRFNIMKGCD